MGFFLGLTGIWLIIMWLITLIIPILLLLAGFFLLLKIIGNIRENNERQRYRH